MPDRYELRDTTKGASKKKFHVYDLMLKLEVFHTNNHQRALALIAVTGEGEMNQHVKDRGHQWVPTDRLGRCGACRK